jgi:hypothetical protein
MAKRLQQSEKKKREREKKGEINLEKESTRSWDVAGT